MPAHENIWRFSVFRSTSVFSSKTFSVRRRFQFEDAECCRVIGMPSVDVVVSCYRPARVHVTIISSVDVVVSCYRPARVHVTIISSVDVLVSCYRPARVHVTILYLRYCLFYSALPSVIDLCLNNACGICTLLHALRPCISYTRRFYSFDCYSCVAPAFLLE